MPNNFKGGHLCQGAHHTFDAKNMRIYDNHIVWHYHTLLFKPLNPNGFGGPNVIIQHYILREWAWWQLYLKLTYKLKKGSTMVIHSNLFILENTSIVGKFYSQISTIVYWNIIQILYIPYWISMQWTPTSSWYCRSPFYGILYLTIGGRRLFSNIDFFALQSSWKLLILLN